MATNLVFNAIVPEVLTKDNYANWSVCVENYLVGQDLWHIVETPITDFIYIYMHGTLRQKNAMALHAIQISCGPEMLSQIRGIKSAKQAWDTVAKINNPQSQRVVDEPPISSLGDQFQSVDESPISSMGGQSQRVDELPISSLGNQSQRVDELQISALGDQSQRVDAPQISSLGDQSQRVNEPISSRDPETTETVDVTALYQPLVDVIKTGNWDATKEFLDHHPNENLLEAKISIEKGFTVLHFAVTEGHVKIVQGLVELMPNKGLEIQDNYYRRTALHCAVFYGFDEMVTCMVEKDKKLLSIANRYGMIPIAIACDRGNKPMIRYLYSLTPLEDLTLEYHGTNNGATLLCYFVTNKMFDDALELLQKCPRLALASDWRGTDLMTLLSRMPPAFPSGSKLALWQRWMYTCMHVPRPTPPSNDTRIDVPNQQRSNQGSIATQNTQVFGKLHWLLSYLLKLPGIKQIYDTKLIHVQVLQLLVIICEELRAVGPIKPEMKTSVTETLFKAAEHGIVEFVMEITKVDPDLLKIENTIFYYAIVYRQEKILSLVYGLHSLPHFGTSPSNTYNMLHSAGRIAPSTWLDRIPGAALQMQRELQWFKEVEHIVPSDCQENCDLEGRTPRKLFAEEHKKLVKEGQIWMKETAQSCAFVGALIVTIMFTAAFTVPGGNNGTTGFPMFLDKKWFKAFILCDAISFLSATTSILIFLGILTSRYAEEDFLKSLPTKMIFGLTTLFISIASMIIAFCATLSLMLHGQMLGIFVPILVLASVPIIVFVLLHFPLLVEIFLSTYGPSIFDRKTKCWYK